MILKHKNYIFDFLNKFQNKYSHKIGQRYVLHTQNLSKNKIFYYDQFI